MKWREVPAVRLAAGRRQGAARGARRGRARRALQRRLRLAVPRDAARALVEVVRDFRAACSSRRSPSCLVALLAWPATALLRRHYRPVAGACRPAGPALGVSRASPARASLAVRGGLDCGFRAAQRQPLRVLARARSLDRRAEGSRPRSSCGGGLAAAALGRAARLADRGWRIADPGASCSCSHSRRCCGSPWS